MVDSTLAFDRGIDEIVVGGLGPESPQPFPALFKLAAARILSGQPEDAEVLVTRALGVTDDDQAQVDPDFAIQVSDLIRLSLKHSAYTVAEPLLLRLLAIKRSKGEDHPEVATTLASLATLRQALGRHESAEQLWRRVLEIREGTLAPNHFALATALEHLGEACAARGKIREAVELFQRAHGVRELTLGADHSSLRVSRDRIADLQLQTSDESVDPPTSESPASAPEKYRLASADRAVASAPRLPRGRSGVKQWNVMPPVLEGEPPTRKETAEPATLLAVAEIQTADEQSAESDRPPYLDVLLSMQQEMEDDSQDQAANGPAPRIFASLVAALKQRQRKTLIGAGALALLVGSAAVLYARNASQPLGGTEAVPGLATVSSIPTASRRDVSRSSVVAANTSAAPAVAASALGTPVGASRTRVAYQRIPVTRSKRSEPVGISIPKLPASLAAGFEGVVKTRSVSELGIDESFALLPPPVVESAHRVAFPSVDQVTAPQRAQLIGRLPTPRYPNQLADVKGDVRVRFDIDAAGSPVISTVAVVNSSNTLFTAEVLKMIPELRFEPARSGGPGSPAVKDVVQLDIHFQPTK